MVEAKDHESETAVLGASSEAGSPAPMKDATSADAKNSVDEVYEGQEDAEAETKGDDAMQEKTAEDATKDDEVEVPMVEAQDQESEVVHEPAAASPMTDAMTPSTAGAVTPMATTPGGHDAAAAAAGTMQAILAAAVAPPAATAEVDVAMVEARDQESEAPVLHETAAASPMTDVMTPSTAGAVTPMATTPGGHDAAAAA